VNEARRRSRGAASDHRDLDQKFSDFFSVWHLGQLVRATHYTRLIHTSLATASIFVSGLRIEARAYLELNPKKEIV
jgi:hypothetical protein